SEFYRNPDQWKLLDEQIFPELISKFGNKLKIWSAACSTGDEPYSLVMALSRHVPIENIKIYATDLDKQVMAQAQVGLYSEKSIASVPDDFKKKYFTKVGNSYQISDEMKKHVEFSQHNLLKDRYQTNYHMIVCRNVLIYFTDEAKEEVFKNFNASLMKGGILFIGSTEQIVNYKDLNYGKKGSFFFEKL
nr:protein-glutamate O-methyltransferase CheR [Eubacterium sp.]